MNIKQLFDKLQNKFSSYDLHGELSLHENRIVWTYNHHEDNDSFESVDFDEEEQISSFDIISAEENLQNAYNEDKEIIELFLEELDESDNWTFSDSDLFDISISLKIS